MKVVVQRVSQAEVSVNGKSVGKIGKGVLIFVGIRKEDTREDADYLAQKLTQLRMFEDQEGKMNISSSEAGASGTLKKIAK